MVVEAQACINIRKQSYLLFVSAYFIIVVAHPLLFAYTRFVKTTVELSRSREIMAQNHKT
jgi:hypothetical protein